MPAYAWKGKNRLGEVQEGHIVSDSKDAASVTLKRNGIQIISIKAQQSASTKSFGKVNQKDLAVFTRQFSVMIDAGLPLVQCLEILGAQQEDKGFQKIIAAIRQDVEQGATLQTALSKHPKAFNDLYVNMVGAGEAGGILDVILQRLSGYIEKAVKLTAKVKSAMIYPIAVISIALIVVVIIMVKVIPVFSAMYEGLGSTLPLPTRICIGMSNVLIRYSYIVIAFAVLIYFGTKQYYKTVAGKLQIDAITLKIPVLGDILLKVAVARFCRTLGTLISSGVPILEGWTSPPGHPVTKCARTRFSRPRRRWSRAGTLPHPLRRPKCSHPWSFKWWAWVKPPAPWMPCSPRSRISTKMKWIMRWQA